VCREEMKQANYDVDTHKWIEYAGLMEEAHEALNLNFEMMMEAYEYLLSLQKQLEKRK